MSSQQPKLLKPEATKTFDVTKKLPGAEEVRRRSGGGPEEVRRRSTRMDLNICEEHAISAALVRLGGQEVTRPLQPLLPDHLSAAASSAAMFAGSCFRGACRTGSHQQGQQRPAGPGSVMKHMHARTHMHTHARTRARAHTHTHTGLNSLQFVLWKTGSLFRLLV